TQRINELLGDPALSQVTAGLYIGDVAAIEYPRVMTKRSEMRRTPPDILITNYKMLDLLLPRADDLPLWEGADPAYVVLDEFHTYDDAQGTDVAMLLRRLAAALGKSRPDRPLGSICPVATSATLGEGGGRDGRAGRRSCAIRRTSARPACASRCSARSDSANGDPARSAARAATSAPSASPANVGPSPSCRSRRIRRRSSSRSVTSRSRARIRSRVSATPATAGAACPAKADKSASSATSRLRCPGRNPTTSVATVDPPERSGTSATEVTTSPACAAGSRSPAITTATYGARSAIRTDSTTAGSTSSGSGASCSRRPS